MTVKATDPDSNSRLTYSITEGNLRGQFAISTEGGEGRVSVARALDPSSERKFVLSVKVVDAGGRFSLGTVHINVVGPETQGPRFQVGRYSFVIEEDAPVNSVLGSVSASASGHSSLSLFLSLLRHLFVRRMSEV